MKRFLVFAAFALIFAVSCSNGSSKSNEKPDSDSDPWTEDTDQNPTGDDDAEMPDVSDSGDTEVPDENSDTTDTTPTDNDSGDTEPDHDVVIVEGLDYESGFIYLEENEYYLSNRNDKSGRAKMWYNFQPADEKPEEKPLFVFYNGGPGSSSALVFLYNTAKKTADQAFAEEGVADNEFNWNQIGNLLYVDARQTGFSFGIVDNPANSSSRSSYFSTSNFNVFVDAADFIRVILRFLESHPKIKANPVIPAGESYGGTRTTALINVLQNVADYAENNRVFYDEALFEEIARHFREIDPSITGMPSKEDVAKQFGRQIMIQPLIMGQKQMDAIGEILEKTGSPLYTIQQETGKQYKTCGTSSWNCSKYNNAISYVQNAGRDIYSYRRPADWLFDYTDVGTAKMLQFSMFGQFIMNDPTKINELYAENRKDEGAFRSDSVNGYSRDLEGLNKLTDLPEVEKLILKARIEQRNAHPLSSGDLESVFGTLPKYDEYYVDLNYTINSTFYRASVDPYDDVNGEMFLENIKTTKTFITHAEEDIIVYAEGTPEATKSFSSVSSVDTGDESFTVHFKDGETATVTFPFYPASSHSVSVNQPEKFFNDVKNWLN
ncbi:hypothetical protein J5681_03090 [bacterium]|nr:hypothetical protein [bacterium]MBO4710886.1 hypothetical protein [bacterium]